MTTETSIQAALRRQAMTSMLAFEVRMLKSIKSEKDDRSLRYFYSTPTREMFGKLMVYARLTDNPYSVTEIAEWLTISRLAAQTMVNDCEAEGWIESTRGKHGKRLCKGSESLHFFAEDWFTRLHSIVEDLKLNVLWRAMDAANELAADKENDT